MNKTNSDIFVGKYFNRNRCNAVWFEQRFDCNKSPVFRQRWKLFFIEKSFVCICSAGMEVAERCSRACAFRLQLVEVTANEFSGNAQPFGDTLGYFFVPQH